MNSRELSGVRALEQSRTLALAGVASELGAALANQAGELFDARAQIADLTKERDALKARIAELEKPAD